MEDQLTMTEDPTDQEYGTDTATLVSVTDTELTLTWVETEDNTGQPAATFIETVVFTRQT